MVQPLFLGGVLSIPKSWGVPHPLLLQAPKGPTAGRVPSRWCQATAQTPAPAGGCFLYTLKTQTIENMWLNDVK